MRSRLCYCNQQNAITVPWESKVWYAKSRSVFTFKVFFIFAVYTEVDGDETLPLSEEFQNHINVFIDHSAKTPLEKYKLSEKLVLQLSWVFFNLPFYISLQIWTTDKF